MIITHQLHLAAIDQCELSELDQMLRAQCETEVTENTTTDRPADERTLATQWITLDNIGTVYGF